METKKTGRNMGRRKCGEDEQKWMESGVEGEKKDKREKYNVAKNKKRINRKMNKGRCMG
jgi:hypothetical protein